MTRIYIFLLILALSGSCDSSGEDGNRKPIDTPPMSARSYDIHIFYHTGYGTPEIDGEYRGWNGSVGAEKGEARTYPGGMDIASSFFPAYGCYSSNDPVMIENHMGQLASAQTGVVCVLWYGTGSYESQPVQMILDTAARYSIRVDFMIADYEGRTIESITGDIRHIIETWGKHEAFYITDRFGIRPLFFVDQAWSFNTEDWATVLSKNGAATIRNGRFDSIFIGAWNDAGDGDYILAAGFDGFYTPWSNAGGWGSDTSNWDKMNLFALENSLIFIPTVRPGYEDSRIHPWNGGAAIAREKGEYYQAMVKAAKRINPPFISIDSFNHWQAGTQIEPAAPMKIPGFEYRNYMDDNGYLYLQGTSSWIKGLSM